MWFTYILICENGSLYTGSSIDAEKRFLTHKQGRGGRYTKIYKPIKLLYKEEFFTRSEAVKRESEIKSWTREKKIRILKLNV